MSNPDLNLLLADDDEDDCLFFQDALGELNHNARVTIVHNGVELMQYLQSVEVLPDALFLDLNMPCKNGFECFSDIKSDDRLSQLPVIIYSTSFDKEVVNSLRENGACHYIRKPGDFSRLKLVIDEALNSLLGKQETSFSKENFIIEAR